MNIQQTDKLLEIKLQKSNRFYISNTGTGTIIKQCSDGVDDNGNSINKESRIIAKYSIEPFNNYIYKDNYH